MQELIELQTFFFIWAEQQVVLVPSELKFSFANMHMHQCLLSCHRASAFFKSN
jgi:hypothetical protein